MLKKHSCEWCKREFHDEKNLINHSCEKKRRWFKREDPANRLGFIAWSRFYELTHSGGNKKKTSNKEFINSRYYNAFVKFGRYMVDVNAIETSKFIDYVIKNNLPIDKWTHDFVYQQYVKDLVKKESPEQAFERMIYLMQQWSQQTGEPWQDFFRKINTNIAVQLAQTGRISPWILYTVDSALDMIDRCNLEQQDMIKQVAPVAQWKIKFMKNKDSVEWIKQMMKDAGV